MLCQKANVGNSSRWTSVINIAISLLLLKPNFAHLLKIIQLKYQTILCSSLFKSQALGEYCPHIPSPRTETGKVNIELKKGLKGLKLFLILSTLSENINLFIIIQRNVSISHRLNSTRHNVTDGDDPIIAVTREVIKCLMLRCHGSLWLVPFRLATHCLAHWTPVTSLQHFGDADVTETMFTFVEDHTICYVW